MADPHDGQAVGMENVRSSPVRRSVSTRTTSGITSPARCTTTQSPMRTSLRRISSSLCSVALVTVTPDTRTGSSSATGVRAPVRPTYTRISVTRVTACSAGNLNAMAHRGAWLVAPSSACWTRLLILITTPSVSYCRSVRRAVHFRTYVVTSSIVRHSAV